MNDPYQETLALADLFVAAGLNDRAEELRSGLAEGATGTEIYMILRWRLKKIAEDTTVPSDLRTRALLLHSFLDHALSE